jgi:hypothetical protein
MRDSLLCKFTNLLWRLNAFPIVARATVDQKSYEFMCKYMHSCKYNFKKLQTPYLDPGIASIQVTIVGDPVKCMHVNPVMLPVWHSR